MKDAAIVLLNDADRRAAKEALVWFADGLRLLRMRFVSWTMFAACAMLCLFAVSLLGASLAQSRGKSLAPVLWLLQPVFANVALVAVQSGMYRAMMRVLQGGAVRYQDMLWMFSAPQRRHLFAFAGILTLCNLLYLLLVNRLFAGQVLFVPHPRGLFEMGGVRVNVNMGLLSGYAVMWSLYSVLLWMLTWAALPLMTVFARVSPLAALRYGWRGTVRNMPALLLLGVLAFALMMAAASLAVLFGMVLPQLTAPLLLLFAVWVFALGNLWSYAAFRHVYTDW